MGHQATPNKVVDIVTGQEWNGGRHGRRQEDEDQSHQGRPLVTPHIGHKAAKSFSTIRHLSPLLPNFGPVADYDRWWHTSHFAPAILGDCPAP